MKTVIKIKTNGAPLPKIIGKGDWIDLATTHEIALQGPTCENGKVTFHEKFVDLGYTMVLPKGYEAHILVRSGTYKHFGFMIANNQGIIDNSYCGPLDHWGAMLVPFRDQVIEPRSRILQFRIQLSQKATFWQKIKWLLSNKIVIEEVQTVGSVNRGGFNSTGTK